MQILGFFMQKNKYKFSYKFLCKINA